MPDNIVGKKMSQFDNIDTDTQLTPTQKTYYKEHALVTTFGTTSDNDATINNYNVPLSDIAGSALPPYDHEQFEDEGKVLVVTDSAATWRTYPRSDDYNTPISGGIFASGGFKPVKLKYDSTLTVVPDTVHPEWTKNLSVAHPVPDPGNNEHRGEVLTVDTSSDDIVWAPAQGGGYEPGTDSGLFTSGSYMYVDTDNQTITKNSHGELAVNYGDGLHYDDSSNNLAIDCYDSGGLGFEPYSTGKYLKVLAGNGIDVGSSGVKISTAGANDGDVLTYNGTTQRVGWAAGGGGGGGGARYTPVAITNPTVSDSKITISPANNTIVTVTGLPEAVFNFKIVAPPVAQGEYIDIIIQVQTDPNDGYSHNIEASGFAAVTMDDYGGKSMLDDYGGWTHISLIGKCMLVYCEDVGGS